jgi:aspartate/methionine/tyrosine aminotransferase
MAERTIICDGFSKTLPHRWRLGYGIMPSLAERVDLLPTHSVGCSFTQMAGLAVSEPGKLKL